MHKSRLRILVLATDAFGSLGGIAQYNQEFVQSLSDSSCVERIVILPRTESTNKIIMNRIEQLRGVKNRWLYALIVIKLLVTLKKFDLIICGHLYHLPLTALASLLFGVPYWVILYGKETWGMGARKYAWLLKRAALVFTISRFTRKEVLCGVGLIPDAIKVLPPSVREQFVPSPPSQEFLSKYDLINKKIILTVGRLSSEERYKGHDEIIELMPRLAQIIPSAVYLVVGDGDDKSRLARKAVDLGVGKSIRFLGRLTDDELLEAYQSSDLFVMPSSGEGFGIVFLEALATGKQVIALSGDGSMDPLQDGRFGIICNKAELLEVMKRKLEEQNNSLDAARAIREIFNSGKNRADLHLILTRFFKRRPYLSFEKL